MGQVFPFFSYVCVCVFFFSSLVSTEVKGKEAALCCQTASVARNGRWPFDYALETSMWGRMC